MSEQQKDVGTPVGRGEATRQPDPKDRCGGGYHCWLCKYPWGWETFGWLCEDCFMALGKL